MIIYINIKIIYNNIIIYTMNGPYFITTLEADIRLHPRDMNNNIVDNIKNNLIKKHVNKCFKDYGYIDKIYNIYDDIKGGIIRAEDNTSSSVHTVKFRCRICKPINNSLIYAKITGINNVIIMAENGPIKFFIDSSNINKNNIKYIRSAYYPVNSNGAIINQVIQKGTYVMVRVMSKKIVKNKSIIIAISTLESVVSDNDVQTLIRQQYEQEEEIGSEELLIKNDITDSKIA
jgi:DNA-directed RNA polymerase subunit E'/Rpb7